jgi:putative PIN family toxin of toxin-antitoxin system
MRLVVDTDVVVAGMRSPLGASAALLVLLLKRQSTLLLSVAVALEYESVCMMPEHRLAAGASEREVQNMVDALVGVSEVVEVHYQWRPQLTDASDEMVLEAAVNGRADAIVTFNRKDYGSGPARFGIEVLSPAAALWRIRK